MNYFFTINWRNILFTVLLCLNIGTLAVFWITQKFPPPPPKNANPDFLIKKLAFDSMQTANYNQLRSKHRATVDSLRAQTRDAKDAFFGLLKQPLANDSIVLQKALAAALQQEQIDIATFQHFKQVRQLCNVQQQQKFDDIIEDVIKMLYQPGPPKGPHPPPPTELEKPKRSNDQEERPLPPNPHE